MAVVGGGRLERQPRLEEPGRRQWDAGGGGVHLDFRISVLLGKVNDGVLHSPASWDASRYCECKCSKILAGSTVWNYNDIFLSSLDTFNKALTQ